MSESQQSIGLVVTGVIAGANGCESATDAISAQPIFATGPGGLVLDVRIFPCPLRRAQVFAAAGSLAPGESFLFVNDHDPSHLHAVLCDRFGIAWSWEYETAGPDVYRVRVGRPV